MTEARAPYNAQDVISQAIKLIDSQLKWPGRMLGSPHLVRQFLRLTLSNLDHECFYVLFLDVQNRLIASEEMFRGTLTQTSVYPREVVKAALQHNAASVMLAHNHPSGVTDPGQADLLLTRTLVQALALVEIRVLDHFIVAGNQMYSFAEHGQL